MYRVIFLQTKIIIVEEQSMFWSLLVQKKRINTQLKNTSTSYYKIRYINKKISVAAFRLV